MYTCICLPPWSPGALGLPRHQASSCGSFVDKCALRFRNVFPANGGVASTLLGHAVLVAVLAHSGDEGELENLCQLRPPVPTCRVPPGVLIESPTMREKLE